MLNRLHANADALADVDPPSRGRGRRGCLTLMPGWRTWTAFSAIRFRRSLLRGSSSRLVFFSANKANKKGDFLRLYEHLREFQNTLPIFNFCQDFFFKKNITLNKASPTLTCAVTAGRACPARSSPSPASSTWVPRDHIEQCRQRLCPTQKLESTVSRCAGSIGSSVPCTPFYYLSLLYADDWRRSFASSRRCPMSTISTTTPSAIRCITILS